MPTGANVKRSDLVEKDPFIDVKKSAKDAEAQVVKLETALKMLKETAKTIKGGLGGGSTPKTTKEINDLNEKMRMANQIAKDKLNIDKQLKLEKAKLQEAQKQENKELRTTAQAQAKLTAEQQKSLGTLEKLLFKNQKLRAERAKLNLNTKQGQLRMKEINAELDRNNKIIKTSGDAMKQQRMNVGNYTSAITGLRNALAKLGLAFGVFSIVRGAFTTIKEFQQGQADLASVLGVNTNEMKGLTDQAKELGATTTFTATQVSELQKEFAKLGFTQQEIQNVTEATLLLAEATGTELGRAAEVAGATIRGFGLSTTETQRIVDAMAKSFSSSSLDMEKFSTAMAAVAPVANQFGYSVEETTALIGTLTDRGIDAATAGTGLRNMFLDANKNGLTFQEALDKIANSSDKTAASFDLFGKRGATLGVVLATNQDAASKLAGTLEQASGVAYDEILDSLAEKGIEFEEALKQINDAEDKGAKATEIFGEKHGELIEKFAEEGGTLDELKAKLEEQTGAAKQMAETQRNTLGGAIALLQSAWDGFILSMDEAGGVGEKLRGMIVFLADNLDTIVWTIGKVIKAFVAYKTVMLALKLRDRISEFVNFNKALKDGASGLSKATPTVKAFGAALKGIGLSVAITLLVELGQAIWDYASGAAEARRQQELFNAAVDRANNRLEDFRDKSSKAFQERINQINRERSLRQITEEEAAKQRKQAIDDQRKLLQSKIAYMRTIHAEAMANKEQALARKTQLEEERGIVDIWQGIYDENFQQLNKATTEYQAYNANQREARLIIEGLRSDLEKLNQETFDATNEINEMNSSQKEQKKSAAKVNTEFSNQIDLLEELNKQYAEFKNNLIEIQGIRIEGQLNDVNREIERTIEELTTLAEAGMPADTTELEMMLDKRLDLEIQAIEIRRDAEIEAIKLANKIRFDEMRKTLAAERETLLNQKKLTDKQRAEIEKNYQEELAKIKTLELDAEQNVDAEILKTQEKANNEIIEKTRETSDEILEIKNDLNDAIIDAIHEEEDATKDAEDAKLKAAQEAAAKRQAIIDALTQYELRKADERIKKIDEEIAKATDQANYYAQLAAEGNVKAQQSLAEQNQIIAQANAQKEQEERRKQQIELASAIISAFNAEIEQGKSPSEAFASAITSVELLRQFVAALPTFLEGTEDTGAQGRGVDGKGGFHAILHPNERVLTKEQNMKIGDYSNDYVAAVMEQHRIGNMLYGGVKPSGPETGIIADHLLKFGSKLDEVKDTIQNRPISTTKSVEIIAGAMKIVQEEKAGGMVTQKTFIVKK